MKRRLLALALAGVMIFSALSGCGQTEESAVSVPAAEFGTSTEETETSAEETTSTRFSQVGTFFMPYTTGFEWDPYNCTSMENQAVMQLIYEGLFYIDNDWAFQPELCESYTVNDDYTSWVFTLREVEFSNGKALTASDVVYSIALAKESTLYKERFSNVESVTATGTYEVTVTLNMSNNRLPCLFDFPIVPNGSGLAPAGTGPFVRDGTTLTKNPSWWGDSSAISFNTIALCESKSAEDSRDNFEIDGINFLYNSPLSPDAAAFHCDYELWESKGTTMEYLGFNCAYSDVFSDARARLAITYAINRDYIAEGVYQNFADAAVLPCPPSASFYAEDLADKYDYDPAYALELLLSSDYFSLAEDSPIRTAFSSSASSDGSSEEEAVENAAAEVIVEEIETEEEDDEEDEDGDLAEPDEDEEEEEEEETTSIVSSGPNPIKIIVMNGSEDRTTAAKAIASDLSAVGFTVTVSVMDKDDYYASFTSGDYDLFLAEVRLPPDFDIWHLILNGGQLNYGLVPADQTAIDLYYDAMENEGNRYEFYQYILEQGYICPICFENNAVFTTRGVFANLDPTPDRLFSNITDIIVN